MTQELRIRRLEADEPAFDVIARWRYDAFFAEDGGTFEDSRDALRVWMNGLGYETALLAEIDGQPAGSCLFVREEIDPRAQSDAVARRALRRAGIPQAGNCQRAGPCDRATCA